MHTGKFTRIRCQGVSYGNYGGRLAGNQAASENPPSRKEMVHGLASGIPELQALVMTCCIDPVLMCSDDWTGVEPEPEPYEAELDNEDDADTHPFKVGDVVEVVRGNDSLEQHGYHQGDKLAVRYAETALGAHWVGFHNDERGEWFTSHFKLVA